MSNSYFYMRLLPGIVCLTTGEGVARQGVLLTAALTSVYDENQSFKRL
jgi:hypothetical protein